jgi:hypothetical protein
MKSKSVMRLPAKEMVKLEALKEFVSSSREFKKLGLGSLNDFKAAVVVDKKGSPKYFVFDTYSLWDLLCAFDVKFEENAPSKEYVFHNPVGWLIDAIETHLPINPELAVRLKKGIEEARKLGLVPFEKIKQGLGLT